MNTKIMKMNKRFSKELKTEIDKYIAIELEQEIEKEICKRIFEKLLNPDNYHEVLGKWCFSKKELKEATLQKDNSENASNG